MLLAMHRPEIRCDTPVQFLKGIGPKRAAALETAGIRTVGDLLDHFPRRYLDRRVVMRIGDLRAGMEATVVGQVLSLNRIRGRRERFVVLVGDGTGFLECVWFQGLPYVSKRFRIGETVAFSGKVTVYHGPQLVHPEFDRLSEAGEANPIHTGGIIPLYPSSETLIRQGFDSRGFRRILRPLIETIPEWPETLPEAVIREYGLMGRGEAYAHIHFPGDWETLARARERFKFEELFFIETLLLLQRALRLKKEKGIAFTRVGDQVRTFIARLSFELTEAQKRVLREIREDMRAPVAMNRLLQGDVGSGKTVVAILAMLIAVENGYQACLMAPTEILAEQHAITLRSLLEGMNIRTAILRGGLVGRERQEILDGLADGSIPLCVGTHALIQEGVRFHRLGLVIIDEQHRFGVLQRAQLRQKGITPDVLVMTATPIPRTLALTVYGDLDVSILDEVPQGRPPVRTVWRKEEVREKVYAFLRKEVQKGHQVYIVYPLIEESEKLDLQAATEAFRYLSTQVFPDLPMAILHGRMRPEEKETIMRRFKAGEIAILVTTPVIEVGVDVPNATVMLIEHAERFGLTQLHQLRGRVGRGTALGTCILLSSSTLTEEARRRLEAMVETSNGFRIAEIDLALRGPGELFGTRQHGLLNLKVADLVTDGPLLEKAREAARHLVEADTALELPDHRPFREWLTRRYREAFEWIHIG